MEARTKRRAGADHPSYVLPTRWVRLPAARSIDQLADSTIIVRSSFTDDGGSASWAHEFSASPGLVRSIPFMKNSPELPYDDRSPDDGALFSLVDLYKMQTVEDLVMHGILLDDTYHRAAAELENIDERLKANENKEEVAALEVMRRIREDRFIRAVGAKTLLMQTFLGFSYGYPVTPGEDIKW